MSETAEISRNFVLFFAMPLWQLMGFADYLCHRATRIERTSGLKESLLHSLMMIEMAIPVTMCLYFEVTALVIVLMIVAFFVHEATALWDMAFAQSRREVWLIEQHIHSYLAVLPFMMGSFTICLNWDHFRALFGMGTAVPEFALRWKEPPLPWWYHVLLSACLLTFLVAPYAEEAWRCWRARRLPTLHPALYEPLAESAGAATA